MTFLYKSKKLILRNTMNIFTQNINAFLIFAIIVQAVVFFIIFIRERRGHAIKILGVYELSYFIAYIIVFLYYIQAYKVYISAFILLHPLYALFSIFFYFFIKKLARGELLKTDWVHFIFPGLILITNLIIWGFLNYGEKFSVLVEDRILDQGNQWQSILFSLKTTVYPLLLSIQAFIYIALDIYEIVKLKQFIKAEFSYEEGINLKWAVEVLIIFSSFFILSLFFNNDTFNFAYLLLIAIIIGTNSTIYFQKYYDALIEGRKVSNYPQEEIPKYSFSSLSVSEKKKILKKVENYMTKNKKFQDPNLQLSEVAKELNTNRQYISQVINEFTGENFYHFANKYRIQEFIKLYREGQYSNLSIEGLANKVGFKSKSSFYSAFKKEKGTTPKNFLKKAFW